MVITLRTVIFRDEDTSWKTAVLLKCDPNEKEGFFKVLKSTGASVMVSENRNNKV